MAQQQFVAVSRTKLNISDNIENDKGIRGSQGVKRIHNSGSLITRL